MNFSCNDTLPFSLPVFCPIFVWFDSGIRLSKNPATIDFTGLFGFSLIIPYWEICGLKWENIDLDNNEFIVRHTVIRVNKTLHKNNRTKNNASNSRMPIPGFIAAALRRIKAQQAQNKLIQPNDYIDEGYVFTHADGRLIDPNYITKRFKQILQQNNLPAIRFHDTRHGVAFFMKYLGYDVKDIQIWLRHSDIGTTGNIYLVSFDMDAKRSIADDLNTRFESFVN